MPRSLLVTLRFAVLMALLLAAGSLPGSVLFAPRRVEVRGAVTVTAEEVLRASGVRVGEGSIFRVPAREIEERLTRHPRIAAASVRVRPPARLVITIRERVVTAAVPYARGYVLVDRHGVAVDVVHERPGLVLVSDRAAQVPWAAPGQPIPSAGVRRALEALAALPGPLRREARHLQLTRDREVVLYTMDGLEVRAGPLRGLRERLRDAPQILEALRAQGVAVEYLDLRVPGTVILKPRATEE